MNIKQRGFTLVELLVVLAIIATLMSLVAPRYTGSVDKAKEAVLQEDLATLRDAIDKYYGDNSKYPASLDDLVNKRYIRRIPVDPLTDSISTWILLPPPAPLQGSVFDVKSGAPGNSRDGTPYSGW